MATFAGYVLSGIVATISGNRNSIYDAPTVMHPLDGWLANNVSRGTFATTQPVEENPKSLVGYRGLAQFGMGGFGGFFYNRIQITPGVIDFGNLMTPIVREAEVWNAYLVSQTVESMTEVGTTGLIMESAFDIPGQLLPLQHASFFITATLNGPNEIDASYTWTISGEDYSVYVYGNRVVVFPFLPDWYESVIDELSWLTTVERSYGGDEQRRSLRDIPRRKTEYTVTVNSPGDSQYLENAIFGWQSRQFAVPLPTEGSRLTAPASIGSITASLDTIGKGIYPGQVLLFLAGVQQFESVEIESVSAGSVTLVRPIANAWPQGTRVFPTELAHLANQQDLTRLSDYYISARMSWQFSVSDSAANIPVVAATQFYRSQEVWLLRPDWSSAPSFTYDNPFISHGDGDMGIINWEETTLFTGIVRQHRWTLKGRSEAEAFRAFLGRRNGRRVPCWVPSWNTDFFMVESAAATSSSITVRDNGYRSFSAGSEVRQDIAIFLKGNPVPIMRRVLLVADNFNGTVALNLDSAVGQSFEVADVSRICLLGLYRLGSDSVSIQWRTDSIALVTLNLVLVKG